MWHFIWIRKFNIFVWIRLMCCSVLTVLQSVFVYITWHFCIMCIYEMSLKKSPVVCKDQTVYCVVFFRVFSVKKSIASGRIIHYSITWRVCVIEHAFCTLIAFKVVFWMKRLQAALTKCFLFEAFTKVLRWY